jgi:hypothetical protein
LKPEDRYPMPLLAQASGRGPQKRHLADLRARTGLATEQLIYVRRAAGRLVVDAIEPGECWRWPDREAAPGG